MYKNTVDDFILTAANSARVHEQVATDQERRMKLIENSISREQSIKKHNEFLSETKNLLVTESIFKLVKDSLPANVNESLISMARNITANFVVEEGADTLINAFKIKSVFLSELASIINSTYSSIAESCKESCDELDCTIKNSDITDFYNKLEQLDYEQLTAAIQDKVSKAEEEFIKSNIEDKATMEKVAEDIKEKIDSVKAKTDEEETAIKQEYARMYKSKISDMANKRKSILEALVHRTCSSVLKDTSVLEAYSNDGKLDTSKCIETAEIMYTFLEAVSTANIKSIDAVYLKQVLDSMN